MSAPMQQLVTTQITNNIGQVTFSNPPVNALSHNVCSGLVAAIDECEGAHVRVVVLRANPKSKIWSAGHDIKEIPLDGQDPLPWTAGLEQLLHRVRNCHAPVIAMVHGAHQPANTMTASPSWLTKPITNQRSCCICRPTDIYPALSV